jgi:hypothetical protein
MSVNVLLNFLLLRAALNYTYKTRNNSKTNWNSFMDSNFSLIKFNVSATSGSSNIKPIFNPLPHVVENFLISVCTNLSDPCLELVYCCHQQEGRWHCPSQELTKRNPSVSDQAIGNKTLVPSTNWWLTWGTLPVLSSKLSLHCNTRFRFVKRWHIERLLRLGRHFIVLTNVALPSGQNAQLAPI